MRPPRALYCNFSRGMPLGKTNDAAYQRSVLDAALDLLQRPSGPVLEQFPELIQAAVDDPLDCPLSPPHDPTLPREVDEAQGQRPAYDRQLETSGRSVVGKVLGPDGVPEAVALFVRVDRREAPWTKLENLGDPTLVAQDISGYFEERKIETISGPSGSYENDQRASRTSRSAVSSAKRLTKAAGS